MAAPGLLGLLQVPPFAAAKCQSVASRSATWRAPRALIGIRASAADAATRDAVLKAFCQKRAPRIILGLQKYDRGRVSSVITAADKMDTVLLLRPLQQTRFKTGYDCKKKKRNLRSHYRLKIEGADPKVFVGFACKVFWPLDDDWYKGSITGYNEATKKHSICSLDPWWCKDSF